MRVALPNLANIDACANTSKCAGIYLASSATRQFVSRQGGCLARKLSPRGVMPSRVTSFQIPGSGVALPSRTVIAERRSSMRGQPSTQIG